MKPSAAEMLQVRFEFAQTGLSTLAWLDNVTTSCADVQTNQA